MKIQLAETRAPGSVIDIDRLVVSRMLIQGGAGSGKSTLARRILEQTVGLLQQIIIDPEGEFSTMRQVGDYLLCSADGAGDVLTVPKTANLLARKIRETGVSAVIDVYDLKPADRKVFVGRFLEGLIAAPKKYYRDSLVFIDEAHMFAPQAQSAESLVAMQDMSARGRKRKLGLICATQRLSKLHKDVVAELQNRIIGQTGLKNDLKSAAEEMGLSFQEAREALLRLKPGQFWTFGPALGPEFTLINAAMTKTKAATAETKPEKASGSLEKVIEALGDLPAQAAKEAKTLADLQAELAAAKSEIRRLERGTKTPTAAADPAELKELQLAIRKYESKVSRLRDAVETLMKFIIDINAKDFAAKAGDVDPADVQKAIQAALAQATNLIDAKLSERNREVAAVQKEGRRLVDRIKRLVETNDVKIQVNVKHNEPFTVTPAPAPRRVQTSAQPIGGNGKLGKGEAKVLTAIAQHEEGVDREQVTVLTGYKRSTRDAYIQRLAAAGMVDVGPPITATSEGIAALGPGFEPLPTGDELREYWLRRLPAGEKAVLEAVIEKYPTPVDRDTISDLTTYKRSTRDAYIQRLRTRQLVTVSSAGVAASEKLF